MKFMLYSFLAALAAWGIMAIFGYLEESIWLLCGYILLIIIYSITYAIVSTQRFKRSLKKQAAIREKAEKDRRQKIENGDWKFPAERFYLDCVDAHVSPDNTDLFTKQKIEKLTLSYYTEVDLPQKFHETFNARIQKFYEQGKQIHEAHERKKYIASITPAEGDLPYEDVVPFFVGHNAKDLTGIDKRKEHLVGLITLQEHKIDGYIKQINALDSMGQTSWNSQKNWVPSAIAGGTIGGAAGAVLAGYSTMQKNQSARDFDATMNKMSHDAYIHGQMAIEQIRPSYNACKEKLELLQNEYDECDKKVAITPEEDLLKYLDVSDVKITQTEGNTLHFSASVQNSAPIPNPQLVLDGVIHGKVYCDNIFVDEVFIPLPLAGLTKGQKARITAASKNTVAIDSPYRLEIVSANLSYVEKMTNEIRL